MAARKTKKRSARVTRTTSETDIKLQLTIEGKGECAISTGIPFMDHMLTLTAAHGFFDLTLKAKGDIEIDDHHTIEDEEGNQQEDRDMSQTCPDLPIDHHPRNDTGTDALDDDREVAIHT